MLRFAQDANSIDDNEIGGAAALALVEQVDGFEDGIAYDFQTFGA